VGAVGPGGDCGPLQPWKVPGCGFSPGLRRQLACEALCEMKLLAAHLLTACLPVRLHASTLQWQPSSSLPGR